MMNNFLTVGVVVLCVLGYHRQVQADPIAKDSYRVEFAGYPGSKIHGSVIWTDSKNIHKPSYMHTINGVSPMTTTLNLPIGASIYANGSSDALRSVTPKIFRNEIECDDNPGSEKTLSNVRTCTP
jgi:hypothetical protein